MTTKPSYEELEQRIAELENESVRLKQPAEKLAKSKALLRNTFDAIPDLLTVHDRNLRIVMTNWHGHEYVPEEKRIGQLHCYKVYMNRIENASAWGLSRFRSWWGQHPECLKRRT